MVFRKPSLDEKRLLRQLLRRAGRSDYEDLLRTVRVEPMKDGGMGSLRLMWGNECEESKDLGKELAVIEFHDDDGVLVVATLYANRNDEPFEVDMWKTDFTPVKTIPETFP